jgi:hypothetical protein
MTHRYVKKNGEIKEYPSKSSAVSMPPELYNDVKRHAERESRSVSGMAQVLIGDALKRLEKRLKKQ